MVLRPSSKDAIGIHDPIKMVANMLSQTPNGMMLRELFINTLEAKADRFENGERKVRLEINSDGKLVMINSGRGLCFEELKLATNLAYTGEHKAGLSARENRGEGAKVASLKFNTHGLRYRSRKDGKISQVMMAYSDEEGWTSKVQVPVLTDQDKAWYFDLGDFTEVTLMGLSETHRTGYTPYVEDPSVAASEVLGEFFRRHYRIESPTGLKVNLRVGEPFRHGEDGRVHFKTISEVIEGSLDRLESPKHRFANANDGVRIEYVKYKNTSNTRRSPLHASRGMGRNTMIAIVWRNEMYNTVVGQDWGKKAPAFGLLGMGQDVTVLIHLPDDYPVEEDRYRKYLQKAGEQLTLDYFVRDVIRGRPSWLMNLIENQDRKKRPDRTLEGRLAAYAEKIDRYDTASENKTTLLSGADRKPRPHVDRVEVKRTRGPNLNIGEGKGTGKSNGNHLNLLPSSPQAGKQRSIPKCLWVTKSELEDYPSVKDTPVYYDVHNALYLINQDSATMTYLINAVKEELGKKVQGVSATVLQNAVMETVKEMAGFKIGQYILTAQAIHRNDATTEHLERSYSPEPLHVVFRSTNTLIEKMCGDILKRNDIKNGRISANPELADLPEYEAA